MENSADCSTEGRAALGWSQPSDSISANNHLKLIAYCTQARGPKIVPAPKDRKWMNETIFGFANLCLPLRMANQAGWFILNNRKASVLWTGGDEVRDIRIRHFKKDAQEEMGDESGLAISHFGHGIVTWRIPYLFRTPPGYDLYVGGPTNWCKDGAFPLSGIVETDWAVSTFTMNWRITRPGVLIPFEEDEPICMIYPVFRETLEQFHPELHDFSEEPELHQQFKAWSASRKAFNESRCPLPKLRWQKHYYAGKTLEGTKFAGHRLKVAVRDFKDVGKSM